MLGVLAGVSEAFFDFADRGYTAGVRAGRGSRGLAEVLPEPASPVASRRIRRSVCSGRACSWRVVQRGRLCRPRGSVCRPVRTAVPGGPGRSAPIQSRPEAPVSSGLELICPASPPLFARLAPSSKWLVNWMRALTPSTFGADSASWTASASGLAGGVGPVPTASASAVAPIPTATTTPHSSSRRERGRRRRMFT